MVTKATDAVFLELQRRYGEKIAKAFADAIQELRSGADLQRLIKAISDGNVAEIEAALHLDPAALNEIRTAIAEAYDAGGKSVATALPKLTSEQGAKFVIRFDAGNPAAEAWVKQEAAQLVTDILSDQRDAIRTVLAEGLRAGQNPTQIALDLVGRIDRATGYRVGGIIGLTSRQAQFAETARAELASGDPKLLRNYLTRALRDKRFDKAVLKAIETEAPVPADRISAAVRSYANRLLKYRGDLIAKVESFNALQASKHEAYRQAIEKGAIKAEQITKVWRHFPNEHPRLEHIFMSGKTAGFNESFVLPSGVTMLYPHDPSAPIGEVAGCHCQADYRINFLHGLK